MGPLQENLLSHCEVFSLYQPIIFIVIILPAEVLTLRTFNFWASDENPFYKYYTCIIKSFFITQSMKKICLIDFETRKLPVQNETNILPHLTKCKIDFFFDFYKKNRFLG